VAKPAEPEGPYYELTKDEITTDADWTSRNITLLGVKIGDKTTAVEKSLGKLKATENLGGDYYRNVSDDVSYAVYTHKMTGQLHKIEVYSRFAGKIKDAKLRRLLSSGNLDYMREILGKEEGQDFNPDTTGAEFIYDAKGFRFVQYQLEGGIKVDALLFSLLKKK
jgi:hypothetical protein